MSLTDLKKQGGLPKKTKLSVDDFIDQANAYAKGEQNALPRTMKRKRNFKNATFTLGEQHIQSLNQIALQSGLAKSQILRLLIEQISTCDAVDVESFLNELVQQLTEKAHKKGL